MPPATSAARKAAIQARPSAVVGAAQNWVSTSVFPRHSATFPHGSPVATCAPPFRARFRRQRVVGSRHAPHRHFRNTEHGAPAKEISADNTPSGELSAIPPFARGRPMSSGCRVLFSFSTRAPSCEGATTSRRRARHQLLGFQLAPPLAKGRQRAASSLAR